MFFVLDCLMEMKCESFSALVIPLFHFSFEARVLLVQRICIAKVVSPKDEHLCHDTEVTSTPLQTVLTNVVQVGL